MTLIRLGLARAERELGVVATIEREPSGDLWLVLQSRHDGRIIAQARVPATRAADAVAAEGIDRLTGT